LPVKEKEYCCQSEHVPAKLIFHEVHEKGKYAQRRIFKMLYGVSIEPQDFFDEIKSITKPAKNLLQRIDNNIRM